jgi:hypothetical protein
MSKHIEGSLPPNRTPQCSNTLLCTNTALMSTKLAPSISLVGHKFGDVQLVDDVALLLYIIDIVHTNEDHMDISVILHALKSIGIKSEDFFRLVS